MALRVSQMYVQSSNVRDVAGALREYCRIHRLRFVRHARYRIDGIRQVLSYLSKSRKQRRFLLLPPTGNWITLWEQVDYSDFADPSVVQFLSLTLLTRTLWAELNDDYNIWAYQIFERGELVKEQFHPECYFLKRGKQQLQDLDAPPGCHRAAEKFNRRLKLPYFLFSPAQLAQDRRLASTVVRVIGRIAPA
jgi:hypothetical protein